MLYVSVCCAVLSVPCSLVVTCWERVDLLAVVFVVFCHFPKYFWSTSELRAMMALCYWFKLSSKVFLLIIPRRYFFCGSFVSLCFVFLMLLRLFIAALWSPADLLALVGDVYCIMVSWVRCGI